MTKQEALEALLTRMREWEQTAVESPARNDAWVFARLRAAFRELTGPGELSVEAHRDALVTLGAGALYLLRDEVDVVVPGQLTLDLDEALGRWTGEGGRGA